MVRIKSTAKKVTMTPKEVRERYEAVAWGSSRRMRQRRSSSKSYRREVPTVPIENIQVGAPEDYRAVA